MAEFLALALPVRPVTSLKDVRVGLSDEALLALPCKPHSPERGRLRPFCGPPTHAVFRSITDAIRAGKAAPYLVRRFTLPCNDRRRTTMGASRYPWKGIGGGLGLTTGTVHVLDKPH